MKFPQIFKLLALLCFFAALSCKEASVKDKHAPKEEKNIPSAEKHHKFKSTPKNDPKRSIQSRDSILRKQKKSKDLDTLKPKVA
ncbi:hypothetical protein [Maribacter sp. HTCC2170]|uniref:hypothetical protein n=1 Tax=Maribacter sp. (strain HTCC2170 / KCCM 42371) TaxID=313603 RepID=UPI00006BD281|nr:hypothetical protein [Maribacter sp. HTCC2170]EAR02279.1 hypothetical protein FB2170_03310 [Maribacter sp. HTCC2170]